jgi:arylsulfatase A
MMKTPNGIIKSTLMIAILALAACNQEQQVEKPNIVMFYIDDWAWNGSPVMMEETMENSFMPILEMPNVEQLAAEGMKFQNAYGSPQCSPARVCLQTGQSSPRNGFTVYQFSNEDYYDTGKEYQYFPLVPTIADMEIDTASTTIAEALKPLGYVSAHVGKWHMRSDPGLHGYSVHDGNTDNKPGNTLGSFVKEGEPQPRRLPVEMTDPKLMFSITEKAIEFIEDQVEEGNPFYCQISHYAMHEGRECLNATREKYLKHPAVIDWFERNNIDPDKVQRKQDPANWLAMGEDLDGRIGAVLDKLEELGIKENTYIVLVSDNGYRHSELQIKPGLTQPLHGAKWWVWNGGIRVPMIVKGPGIEAGSVFKGNVANIDFLPTFLDWAGGDPGSLEDIDGVSLADYMEGQEPDEVFLNRNLYFHYPHYRSSVPHSAMVSGSSKVMHFYEFPEIPMLFDLSGDAGEVRNIANDKPEEHKKLYNEMMNYLDEVGARYPKANPNYDAQKYQEDNKTEGRLRWGPFEGERELEDDEI